MARENEAVTIRANLPPGCLIETERRMNYCSNCGAPATGTAFCGNCGQPMSAGAAASGQPQPSAPAASNPPGPSPAPGAQAVRLNPFADITVLDYARDVIALVLLLVSFGMPWDLFDDSTGKVHVILVTLLSVISLSLPYLKRGGVLPPAWGPAELRLARLVANAPYVVVVLITLVLGYVGEDMGDGVGVGITFGLAGALLAAQGRQSEQGPGSAGDGPLWRWIATGTGALFALLTAISLITFLIGDTVDLLNWEAVTYLVLSALFFLALAALPQWFGVRGDAAWRDVLLLLGVVALFVGVWQLSAPQTIADAWSLSDALGGFVPPGPQLLLVPALAVAASAAGLRALAAPVTGAAYWAAVASRLLQVALVAAALHAVMTVLLIIAIDTGRGVAIVVLVLDLIVLVAAIVGRNALNRDPRLGRGVAVISGGVFILLGIVIAAVLGSSDEMIVTILDATFVSVLWWFGAALALALTAPQSVQREYGPLSASQLSFTGPAAATADVPPSPDVPAPAPAPGEARADAVPEDLPSPVEEPAAVDTPSADAPSPDTPNLDAAGLDDTATRVNNPVADDTATRVDQRPVVDASPSGFDEATASNPDTPLQTLADIAAQEPSLRKHVAANPSTYPELLTWLGQLGDPEVDEALRRRGT